MVRGEVAQRRPGERFQSVIRELPDRRLERLDGQRDGIGARSPPPAHGSRRRRRFDEEHRRGDACHGHDRGIVSGARRELDELEPGGGDRPPQRRRQARGASATARSASAAGSRPRTTPPRLQSPANSWPRRSAPRAAPCRARAGRRRARLGRGSCCLRQGARPSADRGHGAGQRPGAVVRAADESGRRRESVGPQVHRHGAGMAATAREDQLDAGHSRDRRHEPERRALGGERRALLDVRLDKARRGRSSTGPVGSVSPSPSAAKAWPSVTPSASTRSASSGSSSPTSARDPKTPRPNRGPSSSRNATTAIVRRAPPDARGWPQRRRAP